MKDYILAKKAAKAQMKAIEARKQADNKENERFGKLLSRYFDSRGAGLSEQEIMEVNNYLKEYVVLSDEQEVSNYTTLVLTYSTVAKTKLAGIIADLKKSLDAGRIISKSDAAMVAKNVIINKPGIITKTVRNGKMQTETVLPEKKYVVNIDLNSPQVIQSTKYENECEEVMRNIDNQISKWEHVNTRAYVGYKDGYGL